MVYHFLGLFLLNTGDCRTGFTLDFFAYFTADWALLLNCLSFLWLSRAVGFIFQSETDAQKRLWRYILGNFSLILKNGNRNQIHVWNTYQLHPKNIWTKNYYAENDGNASFFQSAIANYQILTGQTQRPVPHFASNHKRKIIIMSYVHRCYKYCFYMSYLDFTFNKIGNMDLNFFQAMWFFVFLLMNSRMYVLSKKWALLEGLEPNCNLIRKVRQVMNLSQCLSDIWVMIGWSTWLNLTIINDCYELSTCELF